MDMAPLGLAFVAGLLSTLSPCVLPLLPVVFATATSQHRFGPAALASGLALSFFVVGTFVAAVGSSLGVDLGAFRAFAATLLMVVGAVLITPLLQTKIAVLATPLGNWAHTRFHDRIPSGLAGQFCVGALLGAVWTPCVGPTLGAASLLAAQGRDLPQVGLTMLAFASGTAMPMLALGSLSREALVRWRGRMLSAGKTGRAALGVALVVIGALILTGFDKIIEAGVLWVLPGWLIELTAAF